MVGAVGLAAIRGGGGVTGARTAKEMLGAGGAHPLFVTPCRSIYANAARTGACGKTKTVAARITGGGGGGQKLRRVGGRQLERGAT